MRSSIIEKKENKVILQIEVEFTSSMLESEKNIQRALNEAGNLASELLLESFDTNGKPITVGSITMTSKGKIDRAYQTPYGEITIARHVYQTSKGGKTFCPLEQNARIILSATPFFAKQISSKYAEMGSRCVKEDFFDNHGRNIAHTFVQDISEAVASVALSHEEEWTYSTPKIEEPLSCISVGIDGTCMLTVTDGWREAMVGTVSIYNILGERVHTIYVGATPEYGKDTFLQRMEREINHVKKIFPNVKVLGLADGAKSNWTFLNEHTDMQVLDFYHVTGYLGNVASAAFKAKSEIKEWFDTSCHRLKHFKTAPKSLIKDMDKFAKMELPKEKKEVIEKCRTYFNNNIDKMRYVDCEKYKYPIGSGVTESACKVLIKQRLCGSGMRWKEKGAAAVISLRALSYSGDRWNQFWQKIDANGFALAV